MVAAGQVQSRKELGPDQRIKRLLDPRKRIGITNCLRIEPALVDAEADSPVFLCGRWPLVQHTDCGFRRWHSVPADPWCALGPPAVGVEVCVCTAGPQEWSLWCGVDGGRLLCSPGLACPWWSQQHALSAVLAVVSVGCLSRRSQGRERGLRVPNQLNGRQSLLTPPVHWRQQWTGYQCCPHCLWIEGQPLVSWPAARHLHPTGWQLGRSGCMGRCWWGLAPSAAHWAEVEPGVKPGGDRQVSVCLSLGWWSWSWLECGSEMWSARRPGWLFAAAIEPRGRQPEDTRGPRWLKLAPEGNMNRGRSFPPRLAAAFCVAACSARWAPCRPGPERLDIFSPKCRCRPAGCQSMAPLLRWPPAALERLAAVSGPADGLLPTSLWPWWLRCQCRVVLQPHVHSWGSWSLDTCRSVPSCSYPPLPAWWKQRGLEVSL